MEFEIIGFDHDAPNSITLLGSTLLPSHRMHGGKCECGWIDTEMRGWLNGEVINTLPDELIPHIMEIEKITHNYAGSSYRTRDRLFLPSESELFGSAIYAAREYGKRYGAFATSNDRVLLDEDGDARWYWTRSALSDQMATMDAMAQFIVGDTGDVEAFERAIFASAQRSGAAYQETFNSVTKLGLQASGVFNNTDEIIRFSELMNKSFAFVGDASSPTAAMHQLTQAMASGRLQGDEYRSIIENAPMLANSIEDYMRNVQNAKGSMKDWAKEGLLTSDVIKASLFGAASEIEAQFDSIGSTWQTNWNQMKNDALMAISPVLDSLHNLAGDPRVSNAASTVTTTIGQMAVVVVPFIALVANGLDTIFAGVSALAAHPGHRGAAHDADRKSYLSRCGLVRKIRGRNRGVYGRFRVGKNAYTIS